jgi:hypothetical protein
VTDLKSRLAALFVIRKALIEKGQQLSTEELQEAFAQVFSVQAAATNRKCSTEFIRSGVRMHPSKFGVSQSVTRQEDDALIRGRGRYVADVAPASSRADGLSGSANAMSSWCG